MAAKYILIMGHLFLFLEIRLNKMPHTKTEHAGRPFRMRCSKDNMRIGNEEAALFCVVTLHTYVPTGCCTITSLCGRKSAFTVPSRLTCSSGLGDSRQPFPLPSNASRVASFAMKS